MTGFKIAPEGYPFISGFFLFTVLAAIVFFWSWKTSHSPLLASLSIVLFCFSLILTLFMTYFFRDPERRVPDGQGLFVSPADGKVILIKDVFERDHLNAEAKEISIFMSPLDVHVNRSPYDGKVITVKYSPGKYMAAYRDDASLKNENIAMVLETENGRVMVRQVAGFIARRAVCRVKIGDVLKVGERYGIIKFSSRLDVFLPKNAEIKVKLGDKVKAGETVLAAVK